MASGPEVFFRFAQPPNLLGYCGPSETEGVTAVAGGLAMPSEEMSRLALAFEGAWPYLELIGCRAGKDPLDTEVVEAYWLGNPLLDRTSLFDWGHSASDRFQRQAGNRWPAVVNALNAGGLPNHAFHVFCVYPWVGLLKEGHVGPSLEVLDRCRISWGRVKGADQTIVEVERQPLRWVDDSLVVGEPIVEPFRPPPGVLPGVGNTVALHWDYICQVLTPEQLERLRRVHTHHLAIANDELRSARLEPSH
ncbi:MAG: DUF6390 family protein [Actinomycetota bacterium]|nr:DUF6390 family protein [Actinomycetota bacterium]